MSNTSTSRTALVATAIAIVATLATGLIGTAAPATAAPTPSAPPIPSTDHVLVTRTVRYPQAAGTFQTQSPVITGPDGALWSTHGLNDIIRMSADGVYTRFAAYPAGGNSWVGSAIVADDQGGFTYTVETGNDDIPHVMHISLDGAVTEIPMPDGASAADYLVAGTDGTAWYEGLFAGPRDPGLAVRIVHGIAQSFPFPKRVESIIPTDDGGAWVRVGATLMRIAPDGTITTPPGVADRLTSYAWPGADGAIWYIGRISGDLTVRVGLVQRDGTSAEKALDTGVNQARPATQQTQRSATWIGAWLPSGTGVLYGGTTPADLHAIPIPASATQPRGIEAGGRLWITDNSGLSNGVGTQHLLSVGLDGAAVDEADLPDNQAAPIAAGPDGTVWLGGQNYQNGSWTDGAPVLALRPDGTLLRGAIDRTYLSALTFDTEGRPWFVSGSGFATISDASSDRLAGDTRYDAAVSIAKAAFPSGAPVVYVTAGQSFPDALSAGPLAAATGGPLLLTPGDALLPAVTAEIAALAPQKIVVVGGPNSVSDGVVRQLRALAPSVSRISGADRYAVSHDIVAAQQRTGKPLFVATGSGFADALTAGAAAARTGGQLLLVPGDQNQLPSGYATFVAGLHPSSIAVVGGSASVSDGIFAQLGTIAPATRYGGTDRYAVSGAVATAFGTPSSHVYLTTGQNFPDAMAAAPLAGRADATLVSIPGNCVPADTQRAIDGARPSMLTVLGGTASVGPNVGWLQIC
ncbi:cell wall-binding repeat-containing protein [Leifsonia sp. RAF41]|uniref:cell wall-binding repeat-containing protein n=1 Tax=Leifsonia sp. RAF41 TaxID=3233056 RepID=UPI003F9629F7